MPPRRRPISVEWAKSLVGLSMKVPDYWWDGCKGYRLHDGVIDSYCEISQRWNLLLDTKEDDALYLMAYEAIYKYADFDSSTYNEFQLTQQPIRDGDDEIQTETKKYFRTEAEEWNEIVIEDGDTDTGGRPIDPIEWEGDEEFTIKITDEELASLRDIDGEIRFEKVFQWCLPRFGDDDDQTLFEFQAARMRNYMRKRVLESGFKPRYYKGDKVITGDHVARFYGACLCRMIHGGRSIEQIFSTREIMDAVPSIRESMTKACLEDLTTCLHYSDDWDPECGGDWDDIYDDPKVMAPPGTAKHRLKHGLLEDGYNKRWQAIVNFGKWITTDESRVGGWYHSCMTIGPEPKPIQTGATIHTICITTGPLSTYKLFARVYGGQFDEDIPEINDYGKYKMISLYDLMLSPFKHKGHCVVMDSAYMSDAMCQVGREEWKINMVGTCQTNRTGAGSLGKATVAARGIKVGTHQSVMYQHKDKPITYAIWADNNYVKTLSNFHGPNLLRGGIQRKLRDPVTFRRNKDFTDVDCPEQQWVYCQTYHLIDKGNGAEAKYDLSTESHLHGWSPKLAARFFNMNLNNAYNIYKSLYNKYHPDRTPMLMRSCINDLTHSLLQQGSEIRTRGFGDAPSATKDITTTSSSLDGRKLRSDAVRQHFTSPTATERQPGRVHISVPVVVKKNTATSYCKYHNCPVKNTGAKRKRAYMSKYACEDCSLEKGVDFFLCNSTKSVGGNLVVVDCHTAYHVEKKLYTAPSPVIKSSTVIGLTG
ncbi:hypothetical protein FRACYDRAFT_245042 [Fragilariopsis cylindrus CCMP1102]|uniref:PiggyBac transposable element-derived protein domain-containing protein n=1 Tax=Fragilariopsis cylindrus CCMP1102 TaxID=635003 RepID=A0A1E7F1C5_9STRA|nr:hypothetical protein FRACYDRAFT_245042 [Fragilariopsis cylindrus CCMP1102]|eukprot:OEU11919.1 hypothetical protein FRACYDRAFT_245042 [Fragilariopsis cylindrus CCMP1102]